LAADSEGFELGVSLCHGNEALHAELATDHVGGEVIVVLAGFRGHGQGADGSRCADGGREGLADDGVVPDLGAALRIAEVFLGKECSGGAFPGEYFAGERGGLAVGIEGLDDLVGEGAGAGYAGVFLLDVDEGVVGGGAGGAAEGDIGQRGCRVESGGDVESAGFREGRGIPLPNAEAPAALRGWQDLDVCESIIGENLVDVFRESAGGRLFQGGKCCLGLEEEDGGVEGGGGNLGLEEIEVDLALLEGAAGEITRANASKFLIL
jgi:hypothetical protein